VVEVAKKHGVSDQISQGCNTGSNPTDLKAEVLGGFSLRVCPSAAPESRASTRGHLPARVQFLSSQSAN
jgi:hypothetical protein